MIVEIPDPSDFRAAGLDQIYLAWEIIIKLIIELEELNDYTQGIDEAEIKKSNDKFWARSQPILGNAFSLIQHSIELVLKGKIAEVSPYLLISRDPRDWPAKVESEPVSFSQFKTLDSVELVRVYNAVSEQILDPKFRVFWDQVRRDRNKIMHSVGGVKFSPSHILASILTTVHYMFSEKSWPKFLFEIEENERYSAFLSGDDTVNKIMSEIDIATRYISPADCKRFFGFDKKRRSYVCPVCWGRANTDWQEFWPHLAQLSSAEPGCTSIVCIVCSETTDVERIKCVESDCKGDVISDGVCLTCLFSQSE